MNERVISMYKKYISPLFSTRAAGVYMILFALTIGIATFIENDFGTSSAQKVIFKAWWFELLLALFGISIIMNIFRYRMVQQRRWAVLTFHLAIIVILLGAGVTRYFGFEGMMHIREDSSSNTFLSADTYLKFEVLKDNRTVRFDEPVLFATLGNNNWKESYQLGNDLIHAEVSKFIPNPAQVLNTREDGAPTLKIVIGGMSGREEYFVSQGQSQNINNLRFNFSENYEPDAINIIYRNDSLLIRSERPLTQMIMITQMRDTLYPNGQAYPLVLRSLYSDGINSFVFGDFNSKGKLEIVSESPKLKNESLAALVMKVTVNGESEETLVVGQKGVPGKPSVVNIGGLSMAISYGAKSYVLPFSIKLYDFIMERYPGTNSAASYASEVQLIDSRKNLQKDFRIYMNNILDYGGYRFFQSSFDKDEKGTYLSVNFDFWGTWISYLGYFLLTIGLVISFFTKNGRFYQLSQKLKNMRTSNTLSIFLFFMILSLSTEIAFSQQIIDPLSGISTVDKYHAELFGKVVVQDHNGRMKPMHTMSRELLRKLARTESMYGLNADQIIMSMYADRDTWLGVPLIKIGEHALLRQTLNITGKYAAYKDFFNTDGSYKLRDEVREAYDLQPIDRGTFEKEVMKTDERVNIVNMIFTGRFFKIIPVPEDPNNTWLSTAPMTVDNSSIMSPVASRFFTTYQPALREAIANNDYGSVNTIINELIVYQNENGGAIMPSKSKINSEIWLNRMNVFNHLSLYYSVLGLAFLALLFGTVVKPEFNAQKLFRLLLGLVLLGFLFHTIGLGLRWYVSGRAPWSNGYESMIYIGWTTTLAGILFTRKSIGGLAATMVLAGTILLVAMLSYLDPEITPLVPVLKSYWLTIHVSLEAGSYGFLMLGAIIGLINLILMIFITHKNKDRIARIVREMTYISEMTLIGGLVMISVGTYLGGVWANESWGRYWGWDAKETWALVTILVYAFILHMRLIPKINGLYAFNLATLFGWASVVMTYFGVNYYLSGLHSYAAGDPIPIPGWVYGAVIAAIVIGILAYFKKRQYTVIS